MRTTEIEGALLHSKIPPMSYRTSFYVVTCRKCAEITYDPIQLQAKGVGRRCASSVIFRVDLVILVSKTAAHVNLELC